MRPLLLFLVTALVAYGIWVVSGGTEDPVVPIAPDELVDDAPPTPEELRMRDRLGRKTGTLSIRARTTDGEVAAGLEVA